MFVTLELMAWLLSDGIRTVSVAMVRGAITVAESASLMDDVVSLIGDRGCSHMRNCRGLTMED